MSQHHFFKLLKNLAVGKQHPGGGDLNSHPWGMGCQLLRNGVIEVLRRVPEDADRMLLIMEAESGVISDTPCSPIAPVAMLPRRAACDGGP